MTPAAPSTVRALVFDVDGTLLLSDRALGDYALLPGAVEVLSELRRRAVPFALLTNGSAYAPAEHAAKLRGAGLPVDDEQMITPSSVAADLMHRRRIRRLAPEMRYAGHRERLPGDLGWRQALRRL